MIAVARLLRFYTKMKTSISLYDGLKQIVKVFYKALKINKQEKHKGRKLALSIIDTISYGIFKQLIGSPTKKAVYKIFKPECSYKTFVVNINRFAKYALLIFVCLMRMAHKESSCVKHTDSTKLPVCLNKNAKHHKTMQGIASWGKTGKGKKDWFYGLKLHMTTDLKRKILSIVFSAGNVHDVKIFIKLNKDLMGLFFVDAGYISEKLRQEFYQEKKRMIIAQPKKNMKKLMTALQYHLSKTRTFIELSFRSLKMFHNLVTSLPRSVNGYFANYIYSLLAYQLS